MWRLQGPCLFVPYCLCHTTCAILFLCRGTACAIQLCRGVLVPYCLCHTSTLQGMLVPYYYFAGALLVPYNFVGGCLCHTMNYFSGRLPYTERVLRPHHKCARTLPYNTIFLVCTAFYPHTTGVLPKHYSSCTPFSVQLIHKTQVACFHFL